MTDAPKFTREELIELAGVYGRHVKTVREAASVGDYDAANLAAFALTLLDELSALREVVKAADRIDGFAVAGSVLLEQRGAKAEAAEAFQLVKDYRAARAKVTLPNGEG